MNKGPSNFYGVGRGMDPPQHLTPAGREWLYAGFQRAGWTYLGCDVCVWCNGPAGTIEHIQPHSLGGRGLWNQAAACARCNSRRGQASMLLWLLALRIERGSTAMAAKRLAGWRRKVGLREGIRYRSLP